MIQIPGAEQVVVVIEPEPAKPNFNNFLTTSFWFRCLGHIFNLAAIRLYGGVVAPLGQLWTNYYPRIVFGEEGILMPGSALGFIINALLAFVEIKSQGQPGFPFQTHPQAISISVTSLLVYGLASAAKLLVSGTRLNNTSIYGVIARLGRIGSLCILVASLFYLIITK